MLSTPPASDIKNAVAPRVRKTNSDFKSVTDSAGISPNSEAANITAILEKPALAPGGINAAVGISPSRNESVIATAAAIPVNAALYDLS